MQVMHYPVGTLCRPGAVELFVGTTYWVAYQDPVIAARVRAALASRFTTKEAVVRQYLPIDQLRLKGGLFVPGFDPGVDRFVGELGLQHHLDGAEVGLHDDLPHKAVDALVKPRNEEAALEAELVDR
jgi:hypothetical protein